MGRLVVLLAPLGLLAQPGLLVVLLAEPVIIAREESVISAA